MYCPVGLRDRWTTLSTSEEWLTQHSAMWDRCFRKTISNAFLDAGCKKGCWRKCSIRACSKVLKLGKHVGMAEVRAASPAAWLKGRRATFCHLSLDSTYLLPICCNSESTKQKYLSNKCQKSLQTLQNKSTFLLAA